MGVHELSWAFMAHGGAMDFYDIVMGFHENECRAVP